MTMSREKVGYRITTHVKCGEDLICRGVQKAKTMNLTKAWLRARLEELVQEMRAEFQGYDATNSETRDSRRAEMQICRN